MIARKYGPWILVAVGLPYECGKCQGPIAPGEGHALRYYAPDLPPGSAQQMDAASFLKQWGEERRHWRCREEETKEPQP